MDRLRIYKYFLLMLCIKSVMNSPTRPKNYDVDEFCDKLLSSDKFEKLIEKVADKAIEKVSDIRNNPQYDSSEFEKHSNRAEKTTWSRQYHERGREPERPRSKVKKMSNIASYSIAPLTDLNLQYKKFTKKTASNKKITTIKTIKPKEPSELKHKSKEKDMTTESKEYKDISAASDKESKEVKDKRQYSDDDYEQHTERTETKYSKKGNYKEDKKQSIEKENKETYKDDVSSSESKSESDESIEATRKQPEKSIELKQIAYHRTNATSKENEFNKEHDNIYSKENTVSKSIENEITKGTSKTENPTVKYDKKEHHSEEKTHDTKHKEKHSIEEKHDKKDEIKHESGEAVKNPETQTKTTRSHDDHEEENYSNKQTPIIRNENGKNYAYQISSEYDEYHEQLKKIQKSRRNSSW